MKMRSFAKRLKNWNVHLMVFLAVLIVITAPFLMSCKTGKTVTEYVEVEKMTDVIREIYRDTAIGLPADSALIKALLECDSIGQVQIRKLLEYSGGQKLKPPEVNITDNVLTATTKIDSLSIYLKLKERYEEKGKKQTVTKYEIVEVNRLTTWQHIRILLANIFLTTLPLIIYLTIPNLKEWIQKILTKK